MKVKLQTILFSTIALILLGGAVRAQVATGGNYSLDQSVIAGGGGTSAGGVYAVTGAIGQAVAGTTSTNAPYSLHGGFFNQSVFAPTAAGVTVAGRARMDNGKGIRNVLITLTTADGVTRSTLTGLFGRYTFNDVPAGQTVILSAQAKRFTFGQPSQVVNLTENADDLDFIGSGAELSVPNADIPPVN